MQMSGSSSFNFIPVQFNSITLLFTEGNYHIYYYFPLNSILLQEQKPPMWPTMNLGIGWA